MIRNAPTLREAVQDMPVLAALEHVLSAYETLSGQDAAILDECADLGLTPQQVIIFCLLRRRLGKLTLLDSIYCTCDAVRDQPVSDRTLSSHICMMRPKLAGRYIIRCASGRGYTMEPAPAA